MRDRISFSHDGRTFRCKVQTGGIASVFDGSLARVVNPIWTYEIDGETFGAGEWNLEATDEEVREQIIAAYRGRVGK